MTEFVWAYASALVAFVVLDAIWLGLIARRFYFDRIGHLMQDRPGFGAASVFYLIYLAGIVVFAVTRGLEGGDPGLAALYGAFFGMCAYATYEVTNYATLRNWPWDVVIVDILWGAALTGATAYFAAAVTLAMV